MVSAIGQPRFVGVRVLGHGERIETGLLYQVCNLTDGGSLAPLTPVLDRARREHQVVAHRAPISTCLSQQRSGDDFALNFGGSLAESLDPQVAEPALQRQLVGKPQR